MYLEQVHYSTVQYSTVQYSTVQYSTVHNPFRGWASNCWSETGAFSGEKLIVAISMFSVYIML